MDMMKRLNRYFVIMATLVLSAALTLGIIGVYSRTAWADVNQSYATPALLTVGTGTTSYTTTYTSQSRYIAGYSLMDYGGSLSLASGQTVTAKIQVSPDGTTWLDYVVVHNAVAATSTTVVPTQAAATFTYARMQYTTSGTGAYTPTMWLMFK